MSDLLWLLALIIPLIAQIKINTSYGKYKKIKNSKGLTGFEVARKILDENGLESIYVVETSGNLTDHYDPTRKVIKLSTDIFNGDTIAAAGVAAHECGHAIQDKEGYAFMRFRSFIFPLVNLVSPFPWIAIMIGFIASWTEMFLIGIAILLIILLFQLVTLPVEFDASSRAKKELVKLKLIGKGEDEGISKMLSAAAFTYVASVLASILQILRLIMDFNDSRN